MKYIIQLEILGASESNKVYEAAYNDDDKPYYLFGAPWLGSTEGLKYRIDLFINGKAGYINNVFVDYRNNEFYNARINGKKFKERFINYSYSGDTISTEDGDTLVTGASKKDKTVIVYTILP